MYVKRREDGFLLHGFFLSLSPTHPSGRSIPGPAEVPRKRRPTFAPPLLSLTSLRKSWDVWVSGLRATAIIAPALCSQPTHLLSKFTRALVGRHEEINHQNTLDRLSFLEYTVTYKTILSG